MVYGIVKFIFIVHHNFGRAVRNPIKHNTTYLEPWRLVSEKGGGGGGGGGGQSWNNYIQPSPNPDLDILRAFG